MSLRQPIDALDKACLAATRAPWSSFAPTWKLDLSGDLDVTRLQRALDWTVARTPWAAASIIDGEWVVPDAPRLMLEQSSAEQPIVDRFIDVRRQPVLEVVFVPTGERAGTLLFHQHHALADGRAFLELLGDFFTALAAVEQGATTSPLPDAIVPRRQQAEVITARGLPRLMAFFRGALVSLSELAAAVLRPVRALPSNTGTNYEGENRTLHLDVPLARLERWRAPRKTLALTANDLLAGALLKALSRWSSTAGEHSLLFPIDVRPREHFRSFANHLSNLQLRWTADATRSVLDQARVINAATTTQLSARLPWLRVLFDGLMARLTPLSVLQRALLDQRRLVTNFSFSNLLPLGTPGADASGRWRTTRCQVERLRITTPCVPPQAVNLTVARSGDVACFNFNFKETAVTEASVEALRQLFAESLDELDATL
ncbi:MAG: hypothetical protein Q8N26_33280 [Myxococcales bacterium]|nr:hypothetical protein [Myxococcales bacterium]